MLRSFTGYGLSFGSDTFPFRQQFKSSLHLLDYLFKVRWDDRIGQPYQSAMVRPRHGATSLVFSCFPVKTEDGVMVMVIVKASITEATCLDGAMGC